MKWTKNAIEELQKYRGLKASLKNIPEQIETLELKFTGISGSQTDRVPNRGGSNRWEDFLINNIDERERLKLLWVVNKRIVNTINRGLTALSEDERKALEYFYIQPKTRYGEKIVENLMSELEIDKTEAYRLKDSALRKYVLNMYGIPEYFN